MTYQATTPEAVTGTLSQSVPACGPAIERIVRAAKVPGFTAETSWATRTDFSSHFRRISEVGNVVRLELTKHNTLICSTPVRFNLRTHRRWTNRAIRSV